MHIDLKAVINSASIPGLLCQVQDNHLSIIHANERMQHLLTKNAFLEKIQEAVSLKKMDTTVDSVVWFEMLPADHQSIVLFFWAINDTVVVFVISQPRFDWRILQLTEAASIIIWSFDEHERMAFYNEAIERLTGAQLGTLQSRQDWYQLVHPGDRDYLARIADEAIRQKRDFKVEYRLRFADGDYGWVAVHVVPNYNKDGAYRGASGLLLNIDEQNYQFKINEAFAKLEHNITQGLTRKDVLSGLMQGLAFILDLPLIWIGLLDQTGAFNIYASAGPLQDYLQKIHVNLSSKGPGALAMRSGKPVVLDRDDPNFADFSPLLKQYHLGGALAIPVLQTETLQGVLLAYWPEEKTWSDRIQQRILDIAPRVGLALADMEQQEWLRLFSTAIDHASNPIMIVNHNGLIRFVNQAFTDSYGYRVAEVSGKALPAIKITDGSLWPEYQLNKEVKFRTKDGQEVLVEESIFPVTNADGQVDCYIIIHRDYNKKEKAEHLSMHDSLTGLPNRVFCMNRLEEMVEEAHLKKQPFAMLHCDINRFREINEAYGHGVGDALLHAVAKRILASLREGDMLCRLSGDEFGVLLPNTTADKAAEVATAIIEVIGIPFFIKNMHLSTSMSIGIAMLNPEDKAQTLVQHAELAKNAAKQATEAIRFFSQELDDRISRFLRTEALLRHAIDEDRLRVYYQPIINLQHNHTVVGAEALVRLLDYDGKMISPAEFIPVAEESGLIVSIGLWVLQQALRDLQRWHALGFSSLTIAVNVAASQLKKPDFCAQVLAIVEELSLNCDMLKLELTESTIMEDAIHGAALVDLSQKGIYLAIDDFGTGYSSLSYLRKLPVKQLKIDRSFVMECEIDASAATIVQAIIGLGQTLGLEVLAEGIESKHQADLLQQWSCHYGQGYYFAKPMPEADFLNWLKARRSA